MHVNILWSQAVPSYISKGVMYHKIVHAGEIIGGSRTQGVDDVLYPKSSLGTEAFPRLRVRTARNGRAQWRKGISNLLANSGFWCQNKDQLLLNGRSQSGSKPRAYFNFTSVIIRVVNLELRELRHTFAWDDRDPSI